MSCGFSRYAHPGTAGTRRYEYSAAPSITPGTLRKLYTGLWAKQADRCWSHHRSPWLNRDSAADEQTRTCGRWDGRRKRLLDQNSSGKIHTGGLWYAFRRGKVLCFVFISLLSAPLRLSCQFGMGSGVSCRVAFSWISLLYGSPERHVTRTFGDQFSKFDLSDSLSWVYHIKCCDVRWIHFVFLCGGFMLSSVSDQIRLLGPGITNTAAWVSTPAT